jgi:hypothetical protein
MLRLSMLLLLLQVLSETRFFGVFIRWHTSAPFILAVPIPYHDAIIHKPGMQKSEA